MERNQKNNNLQLKKEIPIRGSERVKIAFSPDGKYFAIFRVIMNVLRIYKIDNYNIIGLMIKINNQDFSKEYYENSYLEYKLHDKHQNLRLHFDIKSRFLAIYGDQAVNIINIIDDTNEIEHHYELQQKYPGKFDRIIDLQLVSESDTKWRCDIAAQQTGQNLVVIFDIDSKDDPLDSKRQIMYQKNSKKQDILCKISNDFQKIILSTLNENLILTKDQNGTDGYTQQLIGWIHDKKVCYILPAKNDFIFICHREYDQNLDIESSRSEHFKIMITRNIEPERLIVLDVVQEEEDEHGFGEKMVLINHKQDALFYDIINPQLKMQKSNFQSRNSSEMGTPRSPIKLPGSQNVIKEVFNDQCISGQYEYSPLGSYSIMWPYVSMSGIQDTVWLFCAFDKLVLKRIFLPYDFGKYQILHTFITESFDLYYLIENYENHILELWHVDLDKPLNFTEFEKQEIKPEKIFEYSKNDVKNSHAIDIFIRSPSGKEGGSKNKKLFAFFLHENGLYCWIQGKEEIKPIGPSKSLKLIKISEDEFVYRNDKIDEDGREIFTLNKVKAVYSLYQISQIYTEQEKIRVKAYSYDYVQNVVTMMFKEKVRNNIQHNRFKIFDLNTQSVLINFNVNCHNIIGRFVSQLFTLINGHYYFNNKVYKLRSDLFDKVQIRHLDQKEAFNKYHGLLDMRRGEEIVQNTPITSIQLHKMAYFIQNPKYQLPMKLIILPYLHEKRIYLNKMKPGLTDAYYYTSLKIRDQEENLMFGIDCTQSSTQKAQQEFMFINVLQQKFTIYNEGGMMTYRSNYSKLVKDIGNPTQISPNGRIYTFSKPDQPSIIHIFSLQRLQFIFMKKVDVGHDVLNFAKNNILCQANDQDKKAAQDLYDELQKKYSSYLIDKDVEYEYAINDKMDLTVCITNKQEMELEKLIDMTFPENESKELIQLLELYKEQEEAKNSDDKQRIQKYINHFNLLVGQQTARFIAKEPIDMKLKILERLNNSRVLLFYIQKAQKNFNKSDISSNSILLENDDQGDKNQHLEEVFVTKNFQLFDKFQKGNFTINNDNVIFWNDFKIWFYRFNEMKSAPIQNEDFPICPLCIDMNNKETHIKKVKRGSKQNQISITIRQSKTKNMELLWDLDKDKEIEAFDTLANDVTIFDQNGNPYIVGEDTVTICKQSAKMKCFDIKGFTSQENMKQLSASPCSGFRFDGENHNWILCNEYIGLSFSFMTLVIRGRSQINEEEFNYLCDFKDQQFDQEMYNFILNRRTFLTCNNHYVQDHERLDYVLGELNKIDPHLIEQLHYYDDRNLETDGKEIYDSIQLQKISALHIAKTNNRSVGIILHYMSMIETNASATFSDIMHLFVDNPSFFEYIEKLLFSTIQMSNKQTLQVSEQYNNHIVCVKGASSSYVDDYYFSTFMNEKKELEIPNKLQILFPILKEEYYNYPVKVQALRISWILTGEGKQFLQAVLNSGDYNIYNNKCMMLIIEYLYQYYKKKVLRTQFPIYLTQLIIFSAAVIIPTNQISIARDIFSILNMMSALWSGWIIAINTYDHFQTYYRSQWAYFEIVYFILNFVISLGLISTNQKWFNEDEGLIQKKTFRVLASLNSIVIFTQILYYMQIIDSIANIVTVMFRIFNDIFWFVIIFTIFNFAFAISFYLLGQNQIEFDDLNEADLEQITYQSILQSISFVFQIALGQFEISAYSVGKGSQEGMLYVMWVASTFFMMLHLLNFLIAIMGQTFSDNNDVKEQNALRSHLSFIISNWWMETAVPDRDTTEYLITAFMKEDDNENADDLDKINWQLKDLKQTINDQVASKLFEITNKN